MKSLNEFVDCQEGLSSIDEGFIEDFRSLITSTDVKNNTSQYQNLLKKSVNEIYDTVRGFDKMNCDNLKRFLLSTIETLMQVSDILNKSDNKDTSRLAITLCDNVDKLYNILIMYTKKLGDIAIK